MICLSHSERNNDTNEFEFEFEFDSILISESSIPRMERRHSVEWIEWRILFFAIAPQMKYWKVNEEFPGTIIVALLFCKAGRSVNSSVEETSLKPGWRLRIHRWQQHQFLKNSVLRRWMALGFVPVKPKFDKRKLQCNDSYSIRFDSSYSHNCPIK